MEIFIKDLKLFGYHGVNEFEKQNGQYFLYNIKINISRQSEIEILEKVSYNLNLNINNTDKIDKIDIIGKDNIIYTVNYSDIINITKDVNNSNKFDLLETLAEVIALKIINLSLLIKDVEVCVEKINPPIKENLNSVGVKYFLKRKEIQELEFFDFIISIGSNVGDKENNLRNAVKILALNKNIIIDKVSSIYETEPMYYTNQESFYNIVLKGKFISNQKINKINLTNGLSISSVNRQSDLSNVINLKNANIQESQSKFKISDNILFFLAFELFGYLKYIEFIMGRSSNLNIRYGPRIIDLDLIDFSGLLLDSNELKLPHPKFKERNFVLIPLAEIDKDFLIENIKIEKYLKRLNLKEKVIKIADW